MDGEPPGSPDLGRSRAILRVVSLRRSLEGAAATFGKLPRMTSRSRPLKTDPVWSPDSSHSVDNLCLYFLGRWNPDGSFWWCELLNPSSAWELLSPITNDSLINFPTKNTSCLSHGVVPSRWPSPRASATSMEEWIWISGWGISDRKKHIKIEIQGLLNNHQPMCHFHFFEFLFPTLKLKWNDWYISQPTHQLTGGQWKKTSSHFFATGSRPWASRIDGVGGHIGTSDSWRGTKKTLSFFLVDLVVRDMNKIYRLYIDFFGQVRRVQSIFCSWWFWCCWFFLGGKMQFWMQRSGFVGACSRFLVPHGMINTHALTQSCSTSTSLVLSVLKVLPPTTHHLPAPQQQGDGNYH